MGDQQLTTAATWAKHQANISTREGRTKDAALWTQIAEEVDDYLAGPRPYLGLGSRVWWSVVSRPPASTGGTGQVSDVPEEARAAAFRVYDASLDDDGTLWQDVVDRVLAAAAPHIRAAERQRLHDRIEAEERAHEATVAERDNAESWADRLTWAIGEHLHVDFGEHSSMNWPWANALDQLALVSPVSDDTGGTKP